MNTMKAKGRQWPTVKSVKAMKDGNGLNPYAKRGIKVLRKAGWTYKELGELYNLEPKVIRQYTK